MYFKLLFLQLFDSVLFKLIVKTVNAKNEVKYLFVVNNSMLLHAPTLNVNCNHKQVI